MKGQLFVLIWTLMSVSRPLSAFDHSHHHGMHDMDMAQGSGDVPQEDIVPVPTAFELPSDDDFEVVDLMPEDLPEKIIRIARLNRTAELAPTLIEEDTSRELQSEGPWSVLLHAADPTDSAITFNKNTSYVYAQLNGFEMCPGYTTSLNFRTDRPHGLLVFVRQETGDASSRDHLYVFLRHGAVGVRLVSAYHRSTFVTLKGGLQDNAWHSVKVSISCLTGTISVTVDDMEELFRFDKLSRRSEGSRLEMWLGGIATTTSDSPLLHVRQFRGCMREATIRQQSALATADRQPWVATRKLGVSSALICTDSCTANPCPADSRCRNHFSHATCDCSKLTATGDHCQKKDDTILSFHGDGHLSHSLYHWGDAAHMDLFVVELSFRTTTAESLIMLASTEQPSNQHLSLSLDSVGHLVAASNLPNMETNIKITVDDTAQEMNKATNGELRMLTSLNDGDWHHVKLTYTADEGHQILWSPEVFFGDSPNLNQACHQLPIGRKKDHRNGLDHNAFYFNSANNKCLSCNYNNCGKGANHFSSMEECNLACIVPGVTFSLPFVGCLRGVYVDGANVLTAVGQTGTTYTGHRNEKTNVCHEGHDNVLSLTSPRSAAHHPRHSTDSYEYDGGEDSDMSLNLEFHPSEGATGNASVGVLAMGSIVVADTLDDWVLYSDGEFLHYKLNSDIVNLKTSAKIIKKGWNKVALEQNLLSSTTSVSLTLNGQTETTEIDPSIKFISGVTLGSELAALRSCLRKVSVNGEDLDLRRYLNRKTGVVFDECKVIGPCQSNKDGCQHGGWCSVAASGSVLCDCSHTDYEGNRCQFAKYPSSCERYRRHGFNTSGRYKIDVDGTGPMRAITVMCDFSNTHTTTQMPHNIPPSFVVRKEGLKTHRLVVNYEGLSNDQLTDIVTSSSGCEQKISFNCTRARLRLSSETWFSSPRRDIFSNFGTDAPAICPCRETDDCVKPNIACNCDASDGLIRTDSAVITRPDHLPVTGLHFIMDHMTMHHKSLSQLTLGDLVCHKQNEKEDAVSLLNPDSALEFISPLSDDFRVHSVGFAFRTAATTAMLLHKPAITSQQADYRVLLTEAHRLEFQYIFQSNKQSVTFLTSHRLNTAAWQHIWIDFSSSEIRIILNGHQKFICLNGLSPDFEGDIYLGGTPSDLIGSLYLEPTTVGFIGCLQDFTVNQEKVSLHELTKRSASLSYNIGCQLSCDPNPCQNGARCIELAEGQYKCLCSNEHAHWGTNCQENLNKNSITFLNSDTEMRYKNENVIPDYELNPLTQNITFAFRTRELQALLLFTKDHLQNLIQIYLSTPNKMVLLWNTGYFLQSMTIDTGEIALNKGQLVQVHLARSYTRTEFYVMSDGQEFVDMMDVGAKLLNSDQYQQFPFGAEIAHPELTLYDVSANVPAPYLSLHLGGAQSGGLHGKVPGLVGCLSGLRVGNQPIKLDNRGIWAWNRLAYEIGCYSACAEQVVCHNGGVCMDVFDATDGDTTQCHCDDTSYQGEHCDEEIGFEFSGENSLIIKKRYEAALVEPTMTIDFAFSLSGLAAADGNIETVLVLTNTAAPAKSNGLRSIAVGIERHQLLKVLFSHDDSQHFVYTADLRGLNVTDGHRYHVTLHISDRVTMQVNGEKLTVLMAVSLIGVFPDPGTSVAVGGTGSEHGNEEWTNFNGCISNIQFRTRSKKVFKPLHDYDTNVQDLESYVRVGGLPNRATCSSFQDRTSNIVAHNHVAYQDHSTRMLESPNAPERENFQPLVYNGKELDDSSGIKTAGKIGGLIMGAVAIATVVYLCKITKKSRDTDADTVVPKKDYEMVNISEEVSPARDAEDGAAKDSYVASAETSQLLERKSLMQKSAKVTEQEPQTSSNPDEASPVDIVQYVKETQKDNKQDDDKLENNANELNEETVGKEENEKSNVNVESLPEVVKDNLCPDVISIVVDSATDNADSEDASEANDFEVIEVTPEDNTNIVSDMAETNEIEKSPPKSKESSEEASDENISSSTNSASNSDATKLVETSQQVTNEKKSSKKTKSKKKNKKAVVTDNSSHSGCSNEPQIISATQKEKISQDKDAEVEVIDAQKYFSSRKTSDSPNLPPKTSK